MVVELERTFLLKYLPEDLNSLNPKQLIDVYFPVNSGHPKLRLRRNGDRFELTKKLPVSEGDSSVQEEHTISLDKQEYVALSQATGKKISKLRYFYQINGINCEIDIFQEFLLGLVLVDFEFEDAGKMEEFVKPDFCGEEVTQESVIAGGILAGKRFEEIETLLKERYGYTSIIV